MRQATGRTHVLEGGLSRTGCDAAGTNAARPGLQLPVCSVAHAVLARAGVQQRTLVLSHSRGGEGSQQHRSRPSQRAVLVPNHNMPRALTVERQRCAIR